MTAIRSTIKDSLKDVDYRHTYAQEFLDMTLARQIRALRTARGWNQTELAKHLGTRQSRISEMEDEEYGALSIASLKDLSRVFDVYLNIRFTSFSELLSQVDQTSMADLAIPGYTKDPLFAGIETTVLVPTVAKRSFDATSWHTGEATAFTATTVVKPNSGHLESAEQRAA